MSLGQNFVAFLFLWSLKAAAVLLFGYAVVFFMKRASAASRHLVWAASFCGILALPFLTLMLTKAHAPVIAEASFLQYPIEQILVKRAPMRMDGENPSRSLENTAWTTSRSSDRIAPKQATGRQREWLSPTATSVAERWKKDIPLGLYLFGLWAFGAFLVFLRFIIGSMSVRLLARSASVSNITSLNSQCIEVSAEYSLKRTVRLLISHRVKVPMTWGLFRPIVLLPLDALDWSREKCKCVLAHELAHIKRWDYLTLVLGQCATILFWFNPVVWFAVREMQMEREIASDDYVLRKGMKASIYASHLLAIACTGKTRLLVPLKSIGMAKPSQLEGRVHAILDGRRKRYDLDGFGWSGMFLSMLALTLALALVQSPVDSTMVSIVESGEGTRYSVAYQGDTYHWSGAFGPNKHVHLSGHRGSVQVERSENRKVEIEARTTEPKFFGNLLILDRGEDLAICMEDPLRLGSCAETTTRDESPSLNYLVRLPRGTDISTRWNYGDVGIRGVDGNVFVRLMKGDVIVQSTGIVDIKSIASDVVVQTQQYADIRTTKGDIHVSIGETEWEGELAISTAEGDIQLGLPAESNTDVEVIVDSQGLLETSLQESHNYADPFNTFTGTVGAGGRTLALKTGLGNISVWHAGTGPLALDNHYRTSSKVNDKEGSQRTNVYLTTSEQKKTDTLYSSDYEDGRFLAITDLIERPPANIVQLLGNLLTEAENPMVRMVAAKELGQFGCFDAVSSLLFGLGDSDYDVRRQVVASLGRNSDPRIVPSLSRRYQHEEDESIKDTILGNLVALDKGFAHVERSLGQDVAWVHSFLDPIARTGTSLNIDADDYLVAYSKLRAYPEYEEELFFNGYTDLDHRLLVLGVMLEFKTTYISEITKSGICFTFEELLLLKAAGIEPAWLNDVGEKGFANADVLDLVLLHKAESAPVSP